MCALELYYLENMLSWAMPHLVFCRENAQLGNRLIVYAHLLAASQVSGWRLINPTFEPYADWFSGTVQRPHGRSLWAVRWAWQVGKVLAPVSGGRLARARARGAVEIDLQATVESAASGGAHWLLVQGFRIRCPQWVVMQRDYLRTFFTPTDHFRLPAEDRVRQLRQQGDLVVGVHVRQGDYAQHLGGKYFYELAQYADFMRRVSSLCAPRKVAFLVCSQHLPATTVFDDLSWLSGPGSAASDLHALSLCDLILGPPSSFSAWAAFHGGAKLLRVEHPRQAFNLGDFLPQPYPDTRD